MPSIENRVNSRNMIAMWGQIFQKVINCHVKYAKIWQFRKFAHIAILLLYFYLILPYSFSQSLYHFRTFVLILSFVLISNLIKIEINIIMILLLLLLYYYYYDTITFEYFILNIIRHNIIHNIVIISLFIHNYIILFLHCYYYYIIHKYCCYYRSFHTYLHNIWVFFEGIDSAFKLDFKFLICSSTNDIELI
jgi:hypothetical protein